MVSGRKILLLGIALITVTISSFLLVGVLKQDSRSNEVIFEVIYSGNFEVIINENDQVKKISSYGMLRNTLKRVSEGEWVIEMNVTKLSGDTGTLYVYVKSIYGEILVSDSVNEPFGTASVSLVL
jgi:hypothetical protein